MYLCVWCVSVSRIRCQICHGCHGPDRMTAVTKEIERGGGERRDTASREHMLSLREGMVAVCVDSSARVCVCGSRFVCEPENGYNASIIGLCFSNVHTYLHISNYSMCMEKEQWDCDGMCLQGVRVCMSVCTCVPCVYVCLCVFCVLSLVCFISLYCKIDVAHCGATCLLSCTP